HDLQANNWDLVDLSCEYIIGRWLILPAADGSMPDRQILDQLAESDCLWLQRIAVVSTLWLIRQNQYDDTLRIVNRLLEHRHDLIHKAMGWVLREIGKRDISVMLDFLESHYNEMPRTTLRYAIERLPDNERKAWLARK
ncbi:MAG: DNA alkylation repair protein, partial [Paramuribaculum sp.]|nr:DNA alkylation repair protein [Paramuribaculum sp.]